MAAESISGDYVSDFYSIQNNDLIRGIRPNAQDLKIGYVITSTTVGNGYTVTVDLYKRFGITRLLGIKGFGHTTLNSIIVTENPTTTVNNGILTATLGSTAGASKVRMLMIVGI